MTLIRPIVVTIFFCVHSALVQAEMYITVVPLNNVIVGDHRQEGRGFEETRELRGQPTLLADPSRIQIYRDRLLVCDRNDGRLYSFRSDAAGNAIANFPGTAYRTDTPEGCDDFIAHRGYYFVKGPDAGTLQASPYELVLNSQSEVRVLTDSAGADVLSFKGDGPFLYALTSFNDVVRWNLDSDSDSLDPSFFMASVGGCPGPWGTLEAHGGLIYVTRGTAPDTAICVYDSSNSRLLRILSHPDVQNPSQLTISGDELFVVDRTGIYTFDIGAGGPVPPKRVIETGEVEYIWVTQQIEPDVTAFKMSLEEPVDGGVHSGVSNLRGWAVASQGISKVDIFVDGVLFQSAPYGGIRPDVGGAFPDVADSEASGFSLAYNFSALGAGEHTILARAETRTGEVLEDSATFTTTRPGQEFIFGADGVDLSGASCSVDQGRSIKLEDMIIDGRGPWDAVLEWQQAAQGFEAQTYVFDADAI